MAWGARKDVIYFNCPGDGSCLLHAVRSCLSSRYRGRESGYMRGWARKFRQQMALKLDEMYEDLPCSDFADVCLDLYEGDAEEGVPVLDLSLGGMKSHFSSYKFLGEESLGFLSRLLDVNLIILDRSTEGVYKMALSPALYDKEREGTILVLYRPAVGGSDPHFEAAGLSLGGKPVTYFENEHSGIRGFREELGW